MKKLLLSLILASSLCYAQEVINPTDICENAETEFTWAKYEILCFEKNEDPSYQEYLKLVDNKYCMVVEDAEFAQDLLMEAKND